MTYAAYQYLLNGQIGEAILYVLNNYFPWFSFWVMLGLSVYVTVQAKVENQMISLSAFGLYWIVIIPLVTISELATPPMYREMGRYIQALMGIMIGIAIYKLFVR